MVAAYRAEERDHRRQLHAAWTAYKAIYAPIEEEEFRKRVGLPSRSDGEDGVGEVQTLEAVWVPADANDTEKGLAPIPLRESIVLRGPDTWVFAKQTGMAFRVARDVGPIALSRLVSQQSLLVPPEDIARLPELLHENFQSEGIRLPSREDLGLPPLPRPHIVLKIEGSVFSVQGELQARYAEREFSLGPSLHATRWDETRDGHRERAAVERLAATCLTRSRAARSRDSVEAPAYQAAGDRAVSFWTRDLPDIVAAVGRGGPIDEVVAPPGLRSTALRKPVHSALEMRVAGSGLIDVAVRYAAEGIPADVAEIRRALRAKRRWVQLTDGSIAELRDRVAELALATASLLGESDHGEMPRHALGDASRWSDLADHSELDATVSGWRERLRALSVALEPEAIAGLRARLRSYQRTGVAWLQFLAELGVGGVLADDMGLGKTLQALALLAWRRERDGPAPSLVVAPTSVASGWIREAAHFTPDLRTLLLHGTERHVRRHEVPKKDLVVTTYALLRRDLERLRDVRFRYVILDEAQHIKNHAAATTAAARALQAEARLALTGTPLENRILELWSIFEFVNPGMLGSWREFSRRYERPLTEAVAREGDAASAEASSELDSQIEAATLRARIRPFLLRRTKAEVEKDLPPKIESEVIVELTPAQRRGYAALAAATREDLRRRIADHGFEKSRMLVLTALLRLRQMACDPRLIDERYRPDDSAKLGAFRELVSEVIASRRRALVFSQFTQLLALLRADLDQQEIAYAYMDGRTRDRDAAIRRFVEGDMPLFLLSLKAGGTGLNLTAADVVIHLDPWWNPAVEEQATDRAHRIGQQKTVSVYRIVAGGTIEDAILRMKDRKRALANAIIGGKEMQLPHGLTAADIEDLLR